MLTSVLYHRLDVGMRSESLGERGPGEQSVRWSHSDRVRTVDTFPEWHSHPHIPTCFFLCLDVKVQLRQEAYKLINPSLAGMLVTWHKNNDVLENRSHHFGRKVTDPNVIIWWDGVSLESLVMDLFLPRCQPLIKLTFPIAQRFIEITSAPICPNLSFKHLMLSWKLLVKFWDSCAWKGYIYPLEIFDFELVKRLVFLFWLGLLVHFVLVT